MFKLLETSIKMENNPIIEYINRYVKLSLDEQEILIDNITFRKYLKGQYIVQQGDICKNDSFIIKGCSKTFYVDNEGREHIVRFAIENWWTGDLGSFITQTPADYNVQCLENMELIQLSYDKLEQLYFDIPKLERFFRIIVQEAYVASEKRIIRNFSLPAKD